jgi:hypothetical protein
MTLREIIEMTTSSNVGSNLIPQRFLTKLLRRPNLKYKDMTYYTSIDQEKPNVGRRKKHN